MSKRFSAIATFLLALSVSPAPAADLRFAIVAPLADSPFFDAIRDGCNARGAELARDGGTVTCLYAGPGFTLPPTKGVQPVETPLQADAPLFDSRSQDRIVLDFVAAKVDAIALSPADDPKVRAAIDAATRAGIPVVTFDADAPTSTRRAFVGTNARDFGRTLGSALKRWKPAGGKYAILATDPDQPNIAERIAGVRDGIGKGWSEIVDSPVVTTGNFADAVARIDALLNQYFDVDAIISVGAWPMLATDEWRAMIARYKSRIDQAQVVIVVADALPLQKDLVREGQGHVLVGQRPLDMGARLVELMIDLKRGRKVPEVVYVGFDTFTRLDLVGHAN